MVKGEWVQHDPNPAPALSLSTSCPDIICYHPDVGRVVEEKDTWISCGFCTTAQKMAGLELPSGTPPRVVSSSRGSPRSCVGDCGWEELKLETEPDLHARELLGKDGHPKILLESPQMCSRRDPACGPCHTTVRVYEEALASPREEIGCHSGHLTRRLLLPTLFHLPRAG